MGDRIGAWGGHSRGSRQKKRMGVTSIQTDVGRCGAMSKDCHSYQALGGASFLPASTFPVYGDAWGRPHRKGLRSWEARDLGTAWECPLSSKTLKKKLLCCI